jgi:hypothetical protein
VGHRTNLLNQRAAFKLQLPHLTGRGVDQKAASERKHSYQLGKLIALTTLHDLANLPHLTISNKLVEKGTKHYSQANHLVRPVRASAYMPIPGLVFLFFHSILSPLPSQSSHLYSYHFHSPSFSCAKIHCYPSQLLFLPLLIHYFALPSTSSPIPPQTVTRLSLPPTDSLLIKPLYQLTQPQPLPIPDTSTLHYNRNTPKHTQEPQNPAAHTLLPPLTHPTSCL